MPSSDRPDSTKAQTEAVEAAMCSALRALEDEAELARRRSVAANERGLRALLRLDGRSGIRPRAHHQEASEPVDVMTEGEPATSG